MDARGHGLSDGTNSFTTNSFQVEAKIESMSKRSSRKSLPREESEGSFTAVTGTGRTYFGGRIGIALEMCMLSPGFIELSEPSGEAVSAETLLVFQALAEGL